MNGSIKAVVLLSGGLDSATTLAIAASRGFDCHALSFDYAQRHRAELLAAEKLAARAGVPQRIMRLDFAVPGASSLTDLSVDIPQTPQTGIPNTYVPARNTVFLALGLGYAESIGASEIFIGVNAIDYSGYPDCRPEYIAAFQALADLATREAIEGRRIKIQTPLLSMSKSDIIRTGIKLGVDYALTVSCYQPDAAGRACGACDSCRLRRFGFDDAGVPDPTPYCANAGQAAG